MGTFALFCACSSCFSLKAKIDGGGNFGKTRYGAVLARLKSVQKASDRTRKGHKSASELLLLLLLLELQLAPEMHLQKLQRLACA